MLDLSFLGFLSGTDFTLLLIAGLVGVLLIFVVRLAVLLSGGTGKILKELIGFFETAEAFDALCEKEFALKVQKAPEAFRRDWTLFQALPLEKPSELLSAGSFLSRGERFRGLFTLLYAAVFAFAAVWGGILCDGSGQAAVSLAAVLGVMLLLLGLSELVLAGVCRAKNRRTADRFATLLRYMDARLSKSLPPHPALRTEEEFFAEQPSDTESALEDILSKIEDIKIGGDTQSVEHIILMLQREKEKQANDTPEIQSRLNEAMAQLLRNISD